MTEAEVRDACRRRLEAVELWLRRLLHDRLSNYSKDYLDAVQSDGSRIIKKEIAESAISRRNTNPSRYPRGVDALLLDVLIQIVCNPNLYSEFRDAFASAFPDGNNEARTFLTRLVAPRNLLAHANHINLRQAEQVVCYSGDVIESLKDYYRRMGLENQYNAPTIVRFSDSLGNTSLRAQMTEASNGAAQLELYRRSILRPGDILAVEIEVDASFAPSEYDIRWTSDRPIADTKLPRIVVAIGTEHVGMRWTLICNVASKRTWHRMNSKIDDQLMLFYRVLPPLEGHAEG